MHNNQGMPILTGNREGESCQGTTGCTHAMQLPRRRVIDLTGFNEREAMASSLQESRSKWADIWFGKLAGFHGQTQNPHWRYTREEVIEYLKHRKARGMPAWKRAKVVDALIGHRNTRLRSTAPFLEDVRSRLQAAAMKENNEQTGEITDLRVPKHEPEYVQRLRLRMRRLGKKYNTEKAYVKWVKRFLRVFNVGNSTDLEALGQSGSWKKPGLTPCG